MSWSPPTLKHFDRAASKILFDLSVRLIKSFLWSVCFAILQPHDFLSDEKYQWNIWAAHEVIWEQAAFFIVSLWIHLDHELTHIRLEVFSIFGAANEVLPQKRPEMDWAISESAPNIAKQTLWVIFCVYESWISLLWSYSVREPLGTPLSFLP